MASHILAIDQGTTSSRAIVFRSDISIAAQAQQEFQQHFPASGWVEHEPEDIWTSTVATCREAMSKADVNGGLLDRLSLSPTERAWASRNVRKSSATATNSGSCERERAGRAAVSKPCKTSREANLTRKRRADAAACDAS